MKTKDKIIKKKKKKTHQEDFDIEDEYDRYFDLDYNGPPPRKKRVKDPFAVKRPRNRINFPEDEELAAFYEWLQQQPSLPCSSPELKDDAFWKQVYKNQQLDKPPPVRLAFVWPIGRSHNAVNISYVKNGFTTELKKLMLQIGHNQLMKPFVAKPKKKRRR